MKKEKFSTPTLIQIAAQKYCIMYKGSNLALVGTTTLVSTAQHTLFDFL